MRQFAQSHKKKEGRRMDSENWYADLHHSTALLVDWILWQRHINPSIPPLYTCWREL